MKKEEDKEQAEQAEQAGQEEQEELPAKRARRGSVKKEPEAAPSAVAGPSRSRMVLRIRESWVRSFCASGD